MSRPRFEQIRIPAALILIIAAAFIFLPRGSGAPEAAAATPQASIVIGQPGGEVSASAGSSISTGPTPVPTASPAPTATPEPTPEPVAQDGFEAEVLACRSISGSTCNGQLGTLPAGASSFTALVRFTDATAGDTLNALLDGPSGRIDGFPYTLQGGGDGYYYSQFQAGGLPAGSYTLTALRNGETVATTTFRKAG
jgi:hypothetical protein